MFQIQPDNTIFIILSFEGPDIYSLAGGLGIRATELGRALAQMGFESHLFFVGDPYKPPLELTLEEKFILHRCCQQISINHPAGVYENERSKILNYESTLPRCLVTNVIKPAVKSGKKAVILAEEWHTASTVINIQSFLKEQSLDKDVIIFWNVNNTYSLDRINWRSLTESAVITTISRYMKQIMAQWGLNPLIIPNGIPSRSLKKINYFQTSKIRNIFKDKLFMLKVGRYDPNKRWIMAVEALAEIKKRNKNAILVIRGGKEPHRYDILRKAESLGLKVKSLETEKGDFETLCTLLSENSSFDILELSFFVPEEILRILYHAADAVLANSLHEPFGLVGLEVMAVSGIVLTGATGEDYAESFENSIVVETSNPKEIAVYVMDLLMDSKLKEKIRKNAYNTAKLYTWDNVIYKLFKKLEFVIMSGIKG
ncbi:MAG: glycosyltransferase family 4 protein [Armatimonadota bacterium]